jgi:uncharacterized membrane protein
LAGRTLIPTSWFPSWRVCALGGALALAALGGAAHAQADELDGHRLAIAGKHVPLPPGDWHLLAQAAYPAAGRRTGVSAQMRSVVLAQEMGGRLRALVVVRTNVDPAEGGFGIAEDCRRSDTHLARVDTPRGSSLAGCTFIAHLLNDVAPTADPAWRDAMAQIAARQLQAPPLWLVAGFRFADDDDVFDVRYLFDPTLLGLAEPPLPPLRPAPPPETGVMATMRGWVGLSNGPPPGDPRWRASTWYPSTSAQDARRTWVVAQLAGWADQVRGDVRRGFKGRDVDALPWPTPWARAFGAERPPQPGAVAAANGAAGTNGAPSGLPEGPEMTALWKTFSWRAVGSMLDAVVSYVFTGSATIATGITVVGGFVNATAYFIHEMVWSSAGAEQGAGESTTELPPIGIGS